MTIYNPVKPLSFREKLSAHYWNNRTICDSTMYLAVVGGFARLLVAMA